MTLSTRLLRFIRPSHFRPTCHRAGSSFNSSGLSSVTAQRLFHAAIKECSLPNNFGPRLRAYLMKIKQSYDEQMSSKMEENPPTGRDVRCIQSLAHLAEMLLQAEREKGELNAMASENDEEFKSMIAEENTRLSQQLNTIYNEVISAVLPDDQAEMDGIIMELSAGVGGQEAMLFCGELFHMYTNYCERQGWEVMLANVETSDLEGVRHASFNIDHPAAYDILRYEGGVHRVQRVPKTEKSGRIHTSTVTVAILPRPSEVTVHIDPKDLKIETKRASGAGGQHVNTTESAVRIVHLPSGLAAECQTQRSQIRNRQVALEKLRARLYQMGIDQQLVATRSTRKLQVGTSARSEKIRTYNFPQDRITDHRINYTTHNSGEFLRGGRPLDALLCQLKHESRLERLEEFLDSERV